MWFLEWGGAALVLWGYWLFGRAHLRPAAMFTAIAGSWLMMWGLLSGAWGIAVLNFVVMVVNAHTWWRLVRR